MRVPTSWRCWDDKQEQVYIESLGHAGPQEVLRKCVSLIIQMGLEVKEVFKGRPVNI